MQKSDNYCCMQLLENSLFQNGRSWLLDTQGFYIVNENNPNVLVVWSAGEFVPEIEQLPDNIIIEGFTYILNKFISDEFNITKPDLILQLSISRIIFPTLKAIK